MLVGIGELVLKGAVERDTPWEPREEDFRKIRNVQSHGAQRGRKQVGFSLWWILGENFSSLSARAKEGLSELLEDRQECLWLLLGALQG